MHWRVAVGASDAHAMSVVASALEAHGGVTSIMASALELTGEGRWSPPSCRWSPPSCRVELSLSHTHKPGQREGDLRTRGARGDGLCCMVGYGGF